MPARPIRAVHVTAYAWANDDLRRAVLELAREKKINAVELDLKDESGEDRAFHEAKIATARFFADRELVVAGALRRKVEAGAESVMALPLEAF